MRAARSEHDGAEYKQKCKKYGKNSFQFSISFWLLVDIITEKGEFNLDQFIWRMAATTACRMSVMAGDYISIEEQQWILDNIRKCENPFTCPHGRPSIISYTKYELEKMFKRQLD